MTLVMAYADPATREITMVGDTHSYNGDTRYPNSRKIVRREITVGNSYSTVLIGSAGEAAVGVTARNAPIPSFVAGVSPQKVVDAIAKSLQKYGAELPGGINYHGGTDQLWLVGWNGHLWEFVHYDIVDVRPFGAIGAGASLAYGAWDALTVYPGQLWDVKKKLHGVGDLVANRSHVVGPPFQVETISGVSR